MAFTRIRLDNQLTNNFMFFVSGGADGIINENITGGDLGEVEHFWIKEIRVHFSTAFASVEALVLKLSDAIIGSAFNQTFLSAAMLGATDYQWIPDTGDNKGLMFNSGDKLGLTLSMKSGINTAGITVIGWAVAS